MLFTTLLSGALSATLATCGSTTPGTPPHSPHLPNRPELERPRGWAFRKLARSIGNGATELNRHSSVQRDTSVEDSVKPYSSIVVFGGGYCDNAHPRDPAYDGSLKPAPYFEGRYSNGPVFIEQLANESLGYKANLLDYAFGGAVAKNGPNVTVPDTLNQSQQYMAEVKDGKVDRGDGRVLHVWWIGIDSITQIWTDAINHRALADNSTAADLAQSRVQEQIEEVLSQVKAVKENAEVQALESNYLVLPIPPLKIVPYSYFQATDLSKTNSILASQYVTYIGKLATQYNTGLANGLAALGPTEGTAGWVRSYDIPSFWHDMNENPAKFNFDDVKHPCLDLSTNVPCATPDKYLYWDTLHPTTQAHKLIAQNLALVAAADKV